MTSDELAFVVGIILAIPLWRLYHKIFTVFYRDAFWGILAELATAWLTGYYIAKFAISIFGAVFTFIFTAVAYIACILLIILTIWFWVLLVWMIRHKINPFQTKMSEPETPVSREDHPGVSYYLWVSAYLLHKYQPNSMAVFSLGLLFGSAVMVLILCFLLGIG